MIKCIDKIEQYCISSCTAECCKSGKTLKEIGIVLDPCKYLKNDRCTIHKSRPETCKNYPIRLAKLGEKDIVIINKCKAVEAGIIDKEINELSKQYKIIR